MSTRENINIVVTDITGINGAGLNAQLLATCTDDYDGANKDYVDSLFPANVTNIGQGSSFYNSNYTTSIAMKSIQNGLNSCANNPTNIFLNTNMFYNPYPYKIADTTTLSYTSNAVAVGFDACCLATNGKLYCPPSLSTYVLIIDPNTNVLDTTTLTSSDNRFSSASLAPNGKIYCVPAGGTKVLIIDPLRNILDTTTITIPGLSSGGKWQSSVMTPSGILYGIPRNESRVIIINTNNDTYDLTSITITARNDNYTSSALAPNGKIYCPPFAGGNDVLIIDTLTNTASTITSIGDFQSAALAPNGNIYCVPLQLFSNCLIIDPRTNTLNTSSIRVNTTSANKYAGAILAPDGNIYSYPLNSSRIAIVDPNRNFCDNTTVVTVGYYTAGALAPNGKMYCPPWQASGVLIIHSGPAVINMRQCLA